MGPKVSLIMLSSVEREGIGLSDSGCQLCDDGPAIRKSSTWMSEVVEESSSSTTSPKSPKSPKSSSSVAISCASVDAPKSAKSSSKDGLD